MKGGLPGWQLQCFCLQLLIFKWFARIIITVVQSLFGSCRKREVELNMINQRGADSPDNQIISNQLIQSVQYQRLFMIQRLIKIRSLTKPVSYGFSGLFKKIQQKDTPKQPKRPLFAKLQSQKPSQHQQSPQYVEKPRFTPSETLDYLVNKINEVNNFYLGVRHNTKYLRVNRLIKYEQAALLKADSFNISDFPVELAKGDGSLKISKAFQNCNQAQTLKRRAGQIAFSHCRLEPFLLKVQQLVHQYFLSLASEQRFKGLEPNFELQNIKIRNAYKDRIKLGLKNAQTKPEIKIKDITIFKGVGVIRNENYSTDSYLKNQSELGEGFVSYTLYRQRKQRYPEREWLTTKFINARFDILVKGGPVLEVREKGHLQGSTQNSLHNVVVQADLVPPPLMAQHQLTPEQYLRSYRLVPSKLVLTNFDRKNQFFPLTFTEAEKKDLLYNGFD